MDKPEVIAFTFLRNGIYYNYPFIGTLQSLALLADETVLALGDSHDETELAVRSLVLPSQLEILPTTWDEENRQGGSILSQQTNIALSAARKKRPNAWGFYLQCDELLSERDITQLKLDLQEAEAMGCDAIRFRYLHFWQNPDQIAVGKRWYAHEIRAIRLNTNIVSYGDAQSFHGAQKIFESDVPIYHYGHVRENSAYARKTSEFHRWWHRDGEIPAKISAAAANEHAEETLPFNGPHPAAILGHLRAVGKPPRQWKSLEQLFLYGRPQKYSADFLQSLPARHAFWTQSIHDFVAAPNAQRLALEEIPGLSFFRTRHSARFIPYGMRAKGARPWSDEFRARLILASAGLGFGSGLS